MQRIQKSQNNFKNLIKVGGLILPDFKTYCKVRVIMAA